MCACHCSVLTILTVALTQGAVARHPGSQVVLPDHTDLPPTEVLQMQDPLRLDHPRRSGSSGLTPDTAAFGATRETTL